MPGENKERRFGGSLPSPMRSRTSAAGLPRRRERRSMGGIGGRPILLGLFLAMVLGFAVYFRLWSIDYSISSADTELLRKEFDLAHQEAMDESAEWRRMYDRELARASDCERELTQLKEAKEKGNSADISVKLAALQKENEDLLKKLEVLNNELEAEKLRCISRELHG